MAKAFLINSARYLTGIGGNDDLPSPNQGWGMVNLGTLFNYAPSNTYVLDQNVVFNQTNTNPFQIYGQVKDPQQPVKFTLVWTDPAGQERCGDAGRGKCLINDLDLRVILLRSTVSPVEYYGNQFTGQYSYSTAGSSFDRVNNVENIYIAPNADNRSFILQVIPSELTGSISNELLSQDFALVVNNVTNVNVSQPTTTLERQAVTVTDGVGGGDGDDVIEPGELLRLTVPLKNTGTQTTAYAVSSVVTPTTGQNKVTMLNSRASYPDIAPDATETNNPYFTFRLAPDYPCGTPITLSQQTTYNGGLTASSTFTLATGLLGPGEPITLTNQSGPIDIPENQTVYGTISVPSSYTGKVATLKVKLNITHQNGENLYVSVIAPDNQSALLFSSASASPNDQLNNVTFSDDGLSSFQPPYANKTFQPVNLFANYIQAPVLAGTWKLEIKDNFSAVTGTGTLNNWAIIVQRNDKPTCTVYSPLAPTNIIVTSGSPQSGAIGTTFSPLVAKVIDNESNPLAGLAVTFKAPSGGASGTFTNGTTTLVATTNAQGIATAAGFKANNTTGAYTITAQVVSVTNPAYFQLNNVAGDAARLEIVQGNNQGTVLSSTFATRLKVRVRDSVNNPIAGQGVTFVPPDASAGNVAGAIFNATPDVENLGWTVLSDENGIATAPELGANGIAGSYVVVAASGQLAVNFQLSNLVGCANGINPYLVTSGVDDGAGITCGTLSRALVQAVSGTTINFQLGGGNSVTINGTLPAVNAGVTLSGGSSCGAGNVRLVGTGTNRLELSGGAILRNLTLDKLQLASSSAGAGSNQVFCVRVTK